MSISPRRLNASLPVIALLAVCGAAVVFAQTTAAPTPTTSSNPPDPSTSPAIAGLRPALAQVGSSLSGLRIVRWKAPGEVRDSTAADVNSIQRDLTVTLPPLMDQAQGSGAGLLAPSFAIFRNIDALYDVLLRVTETATLAGPSVEADRLEDARAGLESARAELANSLLQSMSAQDAQLAQLRAHRSANPVKAPVAAPTRIVVDDGPETTKHHKKKPSKPQ